jgi:REP element-mobilizing transposase RayT
MVEDKKVANKNGAQAPSPVPQARPAKGEYRRNLPHIQVEERTFFVTFSTHKRWKLPETVRGLVLRHCLHDHEKKLWMHGLVVMPDHVHLFFTPLKDWEGRPFGLAEIMHGIKGASAHSINKLLKRRGKVWEEESFDRIMRSDENIFQKVEYICQNPMRKALIREREEYPWLWREWAEGASR